MSPIKIGIIGCGQISASYLRELTGMLAGPVQVVAVSDIIPERAQERAKEFGVPTVCTTEELLANPEIDIAVCLTMPAQHHEVAMAAFAAGKHLFIEKPLSTSRELGKEIIDAGAAKGLLIAGAPDTFLGAGMQTCRKLIDEGAIGVPISAQAMYASGHSSPRYYDIFTGPMFDMGPYYLTAMLSLLGPVRRVTGSAQIPFREKPYPADHPQAGGTWNITRECNITGVLDFESGAIGAITVTAEAFGYQPRLEIYGTEGTLTTNDPNCYTADITLRPAKGEPQTITPETPFAPWNRGLGVADLAQAIRAKRQPRASGNLMYHVLDIMHGIHEASRECEHQCIHSGVERPAPFDLKEVLA